MVDANRCISVYLAGGIGAEDVIGAWGPVYGVITVSFEVITIDEIADSLEVT